MGLIFCIAMAAAAAPPAAGDVPLEAPSLKKKKPATADMAVPTPAAAPRHWLVGVTGAGSFAASGPLRLGGSVRLSVGYVRPDNADHLGVSLEPELAFAGNGEPNAQKSSAFLFSLPLLASVNFSAGPGLLRIFAGPTFDYYAFHNTDSARKFTDSGESIGVAAGAAYLFYLPFGALGLDARFHYLPDALLGTNGDTFLITVGASYVILF